MNQQPDLLSWTPPSPLPIGGATYDAQRDGKRLGPQSQAVFDIMKSGEWFTPQELEAAYLAKTGKRGNWASLSARTRDFRKPEFRINGTCEQESMGDGLFRYRLVLNR